MGEIFGFGLGVGTKNQQSQWLEVYYPQPLLKPSADKTEAIRSALDYHGGTHDIELCQQLIARLKSALEGVDDSLAGITAKLAESQRPVVACFLSTDDKPSTVPAAYLKLHMLSHRLVQPHNIDLTGIFGVLPNIAWTSDGAIDVAELGERQLQARLAGRSLSVNCVDKFPKMTDYVVPSGVRIAHTARVRLGAHLGEGTTIMHEGFVNFNAGTQGTSMIEGRISAGVVIGDGSDLGGGCSTMGTLSGGGDIVISVGENCLIGANAGIGIPLGDRSTVEAGLYITAGTKVLVLDDQNQAVETVKARNLAGKSDVLFRRNSVTGAVECKTNKSAIALNEELHTHN